MSAFACAAALLATPPGRAAVRATLAHHAANAHTQEQRDEAAKALRDIEMMEGRNEQDQ